MKLVVNMIQGFCMALADSVPGVSGGTIAFLMGFYDKFINSLNDIVSRDKEKRKTALTFLIKLGAGWLIGFVMAVIVLTSLFESHIYQVSSLFIGFIVFAIPQMIGEEKESLKGRYINLIYTLIGIAVVVTITYFNPVGGGEGVDLSKASLSMGAYIFVVGAVAISAMVLPGISGSTLLLIFGLYMPIMSFIKEVLHFEFGNMWALICFGLGVVTGILVTLRFIKKALKSFRSQTIYTVIGLMLGSLYAIVMGPQTMEVPQDPMSFKTFSILFFAIGGALVVGLAQLKKIKD